MGQPFVNVHELMTLDAAATLAEWAPDIVLVLFLRRVSEAIWGDPEAETWNLHPSLLPHYRGLGALERNFADIRSGAEVLGVTIHRVEQTPDTLLTLTSGDHFMVQESMDEVVERAVEYARRVRAFQVV